MTLHVSKCLNLLTNQQFLLRNYSYASAISLTKLYPNKCTKIVTPKFEPIDTESKFNGLIPIEKLDISYSCSSGPGGQNVNKRQTKVEVRFKVDEADWLHADLRQKILTDYKSQINKEGFWIFKSDVTRSQQLNLAHCMRLLRNKIREVDEPPKQMSLESQERIRRGKERANIERLMKKREDSYKKNFAKAPTIRDL